MSSVFELPNVTTVRDEDDLPVLAEADQGVEWEEYDTVELGGGSREFLITDSLASLAGGKSGSHTGKNTENANGFPSIRDENGRVHVSVRLAWNDRGNTGGTRPPYATVQLYANGEASGSPVRITGKSWQYSWTDLPKEDEDGNPVEYTVRQLNAPADYTVTVDGGYARVASSDLSLPTFDTEDPDNIRYKYTIVEEPIDGYSTSVMPVEDSESKETTGVIFTNRKQKETIDISVRKAWSLDRGENTPDSVTLQLLRNGKAYGQPVKLSAEHDWTYTWKGVPKLNDDGTDALYTEKETGTAKKYKATLTAASAGTSGLDLILTNTTPHEESGSSSPKTGDTSRPAAAVLLLTLSILSVRLLLLRLKQRP